MSDPTAIAVPHPVTAAEAAFGGPKSKALHTINPSKYATPPAGTGAITVTPPPPSLATVGSAPDPQAPPQALPQLSAGCKIIRRGDADYYLNAYQYAMSTHADFVAPAAIFQPSGATADADVQAIINWARNSNVAIAVRTGGHQYSAASSTTGKNVQLDLAETYKTMDYNEQTGLLRMGASHQVIDMVDWLGERGMFLPHGMCAHVNVGGHVQTGGYGMNMRSFGLFSDHVVEMEVFTADGQKRILKKDAFADQAEKDLWFSMMGGSPGNFGVMTHATFKPRHNAHYPKSRGIKLIAPYSKERTRRVCQVFAEFMKADLPGLDMQVTISGKTRRMLNGILPEEGMDAFIMHTYQDMPAVGGTRNLKNDVPYTFVMVYLQYGNPGGAAEDDAYVEPWIHKLRMAFGKQWVLSSAALGMMTGSKHMPVSTMDKEWLFKIVREYDYPYVKVAQNNFDTNLSPKFIDDLCDYVQDIENSNKQGLMLIMQLSACGGNGSQTFKNRGNNTAFAWRDSVVNFVYDVFYNARFNPFALQLTMAKQAFASQKFIGPQGSFSKRDARLYWGSHGDRNMKNVWQYYLEPETYARVLATKKHWDPNGVFSPNAFCVGYRGPLEQGTVLTSEASQRAADMDASRSDAVGKRIGKSHL